MAEKKTRLLCDDDVIKAVDKHMNEDGTLDDDISCILEEVKDAISFANPNEIKIMPDMKTAVAAPRVFIFKSNSTKLDVVKVQKGLKRMIEEGCVVVPDSVEFIGIGDPLVVLP